MVLEPIELWTAQTLDELVAGQWQESLVLEFKRELGERKKETAKDISAMANTAGGWIVYGIEEKENQQGIKTAESVKPLTDANTAQRIDDVAAEAIVPPVRYRSREIPYGAGSCVVLRVEPSTACLHMVNGYSDFRYYRRTERAARPMGEREVREALEQVVRQQAEGDLIARQLFGRLASGYSGSFGWLGFSTGLRDERLDPRHIDSSVIQQWIDSRYLQNPRIGDIGYRARLDDLDFGVTREGSAWIAWTLERDEGRFYSARLLDWLVRLAAIASHLWITHGLFPLAPRLALNLDARTVLPLYDGVADYFQNADPLVGGHWLTFPISLADLQPGERRQLARRVGDRVYQTLGTRQCPFFADDGSLIPALPGVLRQTPW
jgi:hypothetical protein